MLDALFFLFQKTSQALGILLALNIPLTNGVSIQLYWILVMLFLLYIFIRAMQQWFGNSENFK